MAIPVGHKINNKYEILKVIDTGGMSTVYIALDLTLSKNWALKEIVKKPSRMNDIDYKSLLTEIEILKNLDHLYLPRIVDMLEDEERIFVVMDYIEGKTLEDIVESEGGLPEDKVIKWGKQLAIVMGYLHGRESPIIYRDMKPANIMLQPNGNIKLFDFGASRVFKDESSWKTVPLGTKGYAAPERYGMNSKFDVRSDIYELGMTLYHLITGHNPSKSPEEIRPITEWNPKLNKGIEKIINKMTETNPNDRYQSTSELLYDLDNYEELDSDFRQKLVKKFKIITTLGAVTVGLFLFSIVGFKANAIGIDNKFEDKLKIAEERSDASVAIEAIGIKKNSLQPYDLMINIFKKDSKLTDIEEVQLVGAINTNKENIESTKGYGDFAYRMAELYTFEGSDLDGNEVKAIQWLDVALENNTTHKDKVGYYKDYINYGKKLTSGDVEEGDVSNFVKAIIGLSSGDNTAEQTLTLTNKVFSVVSSNSDKIASEGVSQKDLLKTVNKLIADVSVYEYTNKDLDSLQKELQSKQDSILNIIDATYNN